MLVMLVVLAALVPGLAFSGLAAAQAATPRIVTFRDAETANLIRRLSHPLFWPAGVDPALVRVTLILHRAINAFVTTGNRMFIHTGLIQQAGSASKLAGVLAARAEAALPPGGNRMRAQDLCNVAAPENLPPRRGP